MRALLTVQAVRDAMEALQLEGKKLTLQTIHAQLDNKGSVTTLMRLKAQIELEDQDVMSNLSITLYKQFREGLTKELSIRYEKQIEQTNQEYLAIKEELDSVKATAEKQELLFTQKIQHLNEIQTQLRDENSSMLTTLKTEREQSSTLSTQLNQALLQILHIQGNHDKNITELVSLLAFLKQKEA